MSATRPTLLIAQSFSRRRSLRSPSARTATLRRRHLRPRRPQPRDPRAPRARGPADRARSRSAGGRGRARQFAIRASASRTRPSASWRRCSIARGVGQVQGVLADLGVSSPQLDDPARGFSFRADGPLDMRMDPTRGVSAADWLATATEQQIREAIGGYGEERFAKQVAKAIVAARAREPLRRTEQLAAVVAAAVRTREARPESGDAHLSGSTDSRQSGA